MGFYPPANPDRLFFIQTTMQICQASCRIIFARMLVNITMVQHWKAIGLISPTWKRLAALPIKAFMPGMEMEPKQQSRSPFQIRRRWLPLMAMSPMGLLLLRFLRDKSAMLLTYQRDPIRLHNSAIFITNSALLRSSAALFFSILASSSAIRASNSSMRPGALRGCRIASKSVFTPELEQI